MPEDPTTVRLFATAGALLGFAAVAAGAFGAHLLGDRLPPERLQTWELAARYQMYHALALLAVAWASTAWPGGRTAASGWLMLAGTLVFCGTVYGLALGGPRWLGAITPVGGTLLLLGWLSLAWAALSPAR